tara:strand:- start:1651 stop:2511 length:861 start_codon:yes stop_codon:yes gene_type:complete
MNLFLLYIEDKFNNLSNTHTLRSNTGEIRIGRGARNEVNDSDNPERIDVKRNVLTVGKDHLLLGYDPDPRNSWYIKPTGMTEAPTFIKKEDGQEILLEKKEYISEFDSIYLGVNKDVVIDILSDETKSSDRYKKIEDEDSILSDENLPSWFDTEKPYLNKGNLNTLLTGYQKDAFLILLKMYRTKDGPMKTMTSEELANHIISGNKESATFDKEETQIKSLASNIRGKVIPKMKKKLLDLSYGEDRTHESKLVSDEFICIETNNGYHLVFKEPINHSCLPGFEEDV